MKMQLKFSNDFPKKVNQYQQNFQMKQLHEEKVLEEGKGARKEKKRVRGRLKWRPRGKGDERRNGKAEEENEEQRMGERKEQSRGKKTQLAKRLQL